MLKKSGGKKIKHLFLCCMYSITNKHFDSSINQLAENQVNIDVFRMEVLSSKTSILECKTK